MRKEGKSRLYTVFCGKKKEREREGKKKTLLFSSSLKEPFPTLAEAWEKGAAHEQIGC